MDFREGASIANVAAMIRSEVECIAGQDSFDVSDAAAEDLRLSLLMIADVLLRREGVRGRPK